MSNTRVRFYHDDGRPETVVVAFDGAEVVLEGELLKKVAAGYFSLYGYDVQGGLKSYGIRKVHPESKYATEPVSPEIKPIKSQEKKDPVLYMKVYKDGVFSFWLEWRKNPRHWFVGMFSPEDADAFGKMLATADGWELSE